MSFLAALVLARSSVPLASSPLTWSRTWKAHERAVGAVLPLSSGDVLTAGSFGEETLRIWSPGGAKTLDLRVGSPVEWAHERGGPRDLLVALYDGRLCALSDGVLKPKGQVVIRPGTHAADPPRRVVYTEPVAVVYASHPDGRRTPIPDASDGVAADAGWTAALFNGRIRMTSPKGRQTSFPFGPLVDEAIIDDTVIDASAREIVALTSRTVNNDYVPRLVAFTFTGKPLWSRDFPGFSFKDLTIIGPYFAAVTYRGKEMNRAGITLLALKSGKTVAASELPRDATALGTDPRRRHLAVGTQSGEVTLYSVKP